MSVHSHAFFTVVDATGKPVPGAKVYTYAAGTTTPQATYSDRALTSANTNPIVANAAGVVGPIYLTANTLHKFVYKTSADVTIRTLDNRYGVPDDATVQSLVDGFTSPKAYSGVGDGVSDDSTPVQNALDNTTSVVDLLGLTWRVDSLISFSSNTTIQNGTLDASTGGSSDPSFRAKGALGAYGDLSANASYGEKDLTFVSAPGSADSLFILLAASEFSDGDIYQGELGEVDNVSATIITPKGPIMDDYTTANGAVVYMITSIDDLIFRNVTFIGSAVDTIAMFQLIGGRRCRFEHCHFSGENTRLVALSNCYQVTFIDCTFSVDSGNTGVYIEGSQHIHFTRCRFIGQGTGLAIGTGAATDLLGLNECVTRFVSVIDCAFNLNDSTGITIAQDVQFIRVEQSNFNIVADAATIYGIYCKCATATFRNNTFLVTDDGAGGVTPIYLATLVPLRSPEHYSHIIRVTDNDFFGSGSVDAINQTPITNANGVTTLTTLEISRNRCDAGDIDLTGASNVNIANIYIMDNQNCGALDLAGAAGSITNFYARNNEVTSATMRTTVTRFDWLDNQTTGALLVDGATETYIIGGDATTITINSLSTGLCRVEAVNCTGLEINGVAGSSDSKIFVNNCYITGGGLEIDGTGSGASPIIVSNNYISTSDGTQTILIDGAFTQGLIVGNYLVTAGNSDINVEFAVAGANFWVVTNNYIRNGTYGIDFSALSSYSYQHNNVFVGQATGSVNGAGGTAVGMLPSESWTLTNTTTPARTIDASSLTVGGAYNQAEVQAIAAAVIAVANNLATLMEALDAENNGFVSIP